MKIAIDARSIERKMTGIGRYLYDILDGIPEFDNKNEYILFSTTPLKDINKNFYNNIVLKNLSINKKLFSPFWLNNILGNYLQKNNFNVFFSPNNLCPLKLNQKIKKIITIHDIMFKFDKSYYSFFYRNYLNVMLKKSINVSDKIITISQNSKRDILKYYDVNEAKIAVIYRASNPKFKYRALNEFDSKSLKIKYGLSDNFVLYVGLIENRKNISAILKIADNCTSRKKNLKFVLIGRAGYGFKKIKKEIDEHRENVIYLDFVSDEDLPFLYNMAKVFIFPSFYEGFGLPVLEAMQSGLPVITSNLSSLPEIVKDYGVMHAPDDIDNFSKSILDLLNDNNKYKESCLRAIKGSSRFNQADLVKSHIQIFTN
jgi:glycosyltransferase involved in cell wall biosynthesis